MPTSLAEVRDSSEVASAADGQRWHNRLVRTLLALGVAMVIGGCTIGSQAVPPQMPECAADEFAFVGETTLRALGLDEFGGPDAGRVGRIWVTAGPVEVDFGGPAPAGFERPAPTRMVCVEWPDGSAMAGGIDAGWQPPAGMGGPAPTVQSDVPWAVIALGVGAVVLIGVSIVAFRRDPAA